MSYLYRINDCQWRRIYSYLSDFTDIYTSNEESSRQFVESVFWVARSGSQWCLLPKEYGNWNVAYQRFSKWAKKASGISSGRAVLWGIFSKNSCNV